MPEQTIFEYAVVRVVPRVEREEFLNVGVVLYCRQLKFLGVRIFLNDERLCAFSNSLAAVEIKAHLFAFEQICKGNRAAGPIAKLEVASRFRWLTATRSTVLQASKVHAGLCTDPLETLNKLFEALVL